MGSIKDDLTDSQRTDLFLQVARDRVTGKERDGKIECRPLFRDKDKASAVFFVASGRYYDSGGSGDDKGMDLVELLARLRWEGCTSEEEVCRRIRSTIGPTSQSPTERPITTLPQSEAPKPITSKGKFEVGEHVEPWLPYPRVGDGPRNLVWFRCRPLRSFCAAYPGVTLQSLRQSYAFSCWLYPKREDYRQAGIAVPIWGDDFGASMTGDDVLTADLRGLIVMTNNGSKMLLPPSDGVAQDPAKRIAAWKSSAGIIGQVPRLRNASRIFISEGLTDTLAAVASNADSERVVVSSSNGAHDHAFIPWIAKLMKWQDPEIVICGDCDYSGQEGMFARAKMLKAAGFTRVLIIPPWVPVVPKNGADLRSLLAEGKSFEAILSAARPATTAELKKVKVSRKSSREKGDELESVPTAFPSATGGPPSLLSDEGQTEAANAQRLIQRHGAEFLHCHPWGKTLVWDGSRWKIDDRGTLKYWTATMVAEMWGSIGSALGNKEGRREAEDAVAFIKKSNSKTSINNVIELAGYVPEVTVLPEELDTDPWLLNVQNGTLDLQTGELRTFNPADRITKLCPTEFLPEFDSSVWEQFVASILPDPEVALFVQRFLGYSLTGLVTEQVLPIFWGCGSNGKSTLLNAILDVLGGDFAIKMDKRLIANRGPAGHSTELMDLFGKRFVISSETEDGEKLAESAIKDLTGGEVIRGRRMREDTWEYKPTAKIVLATNHLPEIGGTDHAIWRRIRNVAFSQRFVRPEEAAEGDPVIDPELGKKLAAIRPGILAWMVRGCLDWQKHGLPAPAAIVASTNDYRTDQDRLATFLEERCIRLPGEKVRASVAYAAYKKWAESGGEAPVSVKTFGTRMKSIFSAVTSNGVWYRGFSIKPERDDAPQPDTDDNAFT